ncbi:hypothetical protein [Anaerobium acetethylicum]|uniref:Uncharacterized protein n=1 Tax=Anaerobium acetethylicum TaxID=1619234 RepID=A0A1D3TQG6_9FIRM|nr:hypothetical protein [Anaerobium acetethylicum]SCP95803.1 hypothetical protein SAMN05421730_1002214 [Anaerobium acetethylicum]
MNTLTIIIYIVNAAILFGIVSIIICLRKHLKNKNRKKEFDKMKIDDLK